MTRGVLLFLFTAWLSFGLSGYLVGYAVDYVNGTAEVHYFFMLENGTLLPVAGPVPYWLVGTGKAVETELVVEGGVYKAKVLAELPAQAIPRRSVSGPLLVTLVAAKFANNATEPYNMSYIHDVVFGPFPSMRHFWESASGGAIIIRPYYIHWGWVQLPKTASDYCSTGPVDAFRNIASDVIQILYSRGVKLPSYSYLIVVLNQMLPCHPEAAGLGTTGHWSFNTPYGTVWLAVSQIYHYADWLKSMPDVNVFAHEFGHNLGLGHSGTGLSEYDNHWDVMGDGAWSMLSSWLGATYYFLPTGLTVAHYYYLGWGAFVGSGVGTWTVGPRQGVYIPYSGGVYTVEYKCGGAYEQFLDWCGVVVHNVTSSPINRRWVFFVPIFNVTGTWTSWANFLDVGQSAWVGGVRVSVLWRNSTHARLVVGVPTLADVVGANATFVVGGRAATIDSVAAVYARQVFSPTATYTWPGRGFFSPLFAYLDAERWLAQLRRWWDSASGSWNYVSVPYPGVVVSVGGPLANSLTAALNPPGRPGVGGLPFYFDPSVGGIRDGRTGAYWTKNAAVVAVVVNGSRVYVLVWGLGGEDTRRAARWLAECVPPRAWGVVINTSDFRVLASWPSGFEGPSSCPGTVYVTAAVVGANAASIDAVGAAMATGGLGMLDVEADLSRLPPLVYSVGGPFPNSFTRYFNPPDRPGFGGLPFYYSTSLGGIVDGRTGSLLCTSSCFVVAKLNVDGKSVVLAWGIGGEDTRAAAAYLRYHGRDLLSARGNSARVVQWRYLNYSGIRYGLSFTPLASWP